jgi:hypothetical protein
MADIVLIHRYIIIMKRSVQLSSQRVVKVVMQATILEEVCLEGQAHKTQTTTVFTFQHGPFNLFHPRKQLQSHACGCSCFSFGMNQSSVLESFTSHIIKQLFLNEKRNLVSIFGLGTFHLESQKRSATQRKEKRNPTVSN